MWVKTLSFLVNLFGATFLFWAGIYAGVWWIERPCGWPNYPVRWGLIHFHVGFGAGRACRDARRDALDKAAAARVRIVVLRQAQVSAQIQGADVAAQAQIRWRTREIIREVPSVVTPILDRDFPLSVGWVRAHDAAAGGLPLAAGAAASADDAASGVKPSAALAVIAANYGDCRADAQQLGDFQRWYAGVRAAQR